MKLRRLYLLFCVLGLVLPYSEFVPWLVEHRALHLSIFLHDLFANRISAFFAIDVIVSAIVLISFIQTEGKRLQMRLLWLPIVSVFLVGGSLGLPLFLYLRQLQLDRSPQRQFEMRA
jgi:Terpene cyclase DEP1